MKFKRARVHPGQVASLSKRWSINRQLFKPMANLESRMKLTCISPDSERKPENPEETFEPKAFLVSANSTTTPPSCHPCRCYVQYNAYIYGNKLYILHIMVFWYVKVRINTELIQLIVQIKKEIEMTHKLACMGWSREILHLSFSVVGFMISVFLKLHLTRVTRHVRTDPICCSPEQQHSFDLGPQLSGVIHYVNINFSLGKGFEKVQPCTLQDTWCVRVLKDWNMGLEWIENDMGVCSCFPNGAPVN